MGYNRSGQRAKEKKRRHAREQRRLARKAEAAAGASGGMVTKLKDTSAAQAVKDAVT